MSRLTVVIPCKSGIAPEVTLKSLECQTFRDWVVVMVPDFACKGAPWARNRGFELVQSELVLFSDSDICWYPQAFEQMIGTLDAHPEISYAYGSFRLLDKHGQFTGSIQAAREFDAARLRHMNFVSTMSIMRAKDFVGFDESLKRLQDWALFLDMLELGRIGKHCGHIIFDTCYSEGGITAGSVSWEDAVKQVRRRHQQAKVENS